MLLLEALAPEGLGRRPRPLRPSDEPRDATDVVSASCCTLIQIERPKSFFNVMMANLGDESEIFGVAVVVLLVEDALERWRRRHGRNFELGVV